MAGRRSGAAGGAQASARLGGSEGTGGGREIASVNLEHLDRGVADKESCLCDRRNGREVGRRCLERLGRFRSIPKRDHGAILPEGASFRWRRRLCG